MGCSEAAGQVPDTLLLCLFREPDLRKRPEEEQTSSSRKEGASQPSSARVLWGTCWRSARGGWGGVQGLPVLAQGGSSSLQVTPRSGAGRRQGALRPLWPLCVLGEDPDVLSFWSSSSWGVLIRHVRADSSRGSQCCPAALGQPSASPSPGLGPRKEALGSRSIWGHRLLWQRPPQGPPGREHAVGLFRRQPHSPGCSPPHEPPGRPSLPGAACHDLAKHGGFPHRTLCSSEPGLAVLRTQPSSRGRNAIQRGGTISPGSGHSGATAQDRDSGIVPCHHHPALLSFCMS